MVYVDVNEHAEQARKYLLAGRLKRLGKCNAYDKEPLRLNKSQRPHNKDDSVRTDSNRENSLVVNLLFDPFHQQRYVFGRRQLRWFLVVFAVAPQILVLGPAAHGRTHFIGAPVAYNTVDQIDSIEKIDDMHSYPVV